MGLPKPTPHRRANEVGDEEYIRFAEGNSLRGLCSQLGTTFSSTHKYLHETNPHLGAIVLPLLKNGGRPIVKRNAPPPPEITGAGPIVEPDIEEIKHSAIRRFRAKQEKARKKNAQTVRFPKGPVALIFCGDQHIGNAGADVERMFDEQLIINETPGAYVWQMGDVVDNFVVGKLIAENWKPSIPVWEQWMLGKEYLAGFGKRLVAYCGGNHEAWTAKLSGIDYRRDICPNGVLYDGDEIKATVEVGEHRFKVWSRHRWKGSSMYNMTHGQERGAKFDDPDHDVYVGAHYHKGAVSREFVHKGKRKVAILTGAYKTVDDYALEQGFPGHDGSTAVGVVLHEDGSFFSCADLTAIQNYMRALYPAEEAA